LKQRNTIAVFRSIRSIKQKSGISNQEVLLAATKTAAECLDRQNQIGTIELGKLADMLVLKADPLLDIGIFKDQSNIQHVIQGGQVLK
jgi:imidazolonepropionase-like amidohydrolase